MAVDTALKRLSAVHVSMPWRTALPLPSGTVDQAERQTAGLHYSGILAANPNPPASSARTTYQPIQTFGQMFNR